MRTWFAGLWLAFALLSGALLSGVNAYADGQPQALPVSPLLIETGSGSVEHFTVELAETEDSRAIGLMYRKSLDPGHGMLFDFGGLRQVSFWMKNTYVPLDILFIRADGRIANIAADTEPLSLTPLPSLGPVVAVLELVAGSAARLGIRPGDRVRHQALGNLSAGGK